ncbi:hypothetical protein Hanom_Chr15g01384701 [Helianthus anomalus]
MMFVPQACVASDVKGLVSLCIVSILASRVLLYVFFEVRYKFVDSFFHIFIYYFFNYANWNCLSP